MLNCSRCASLKPFLYSRFDKVIFIRKAYVRLGIRDELIFANTGGRVIGRTF